MKKALIVILSLVTFFFCDKIYAISNITINNYSLVPLFNKDIFVYNVFVDTDEITIAIKKENEKEEVEGGGNVKLNGKETIVNINVKDINGNEKVYTLNIFKNFDNKYDENDSSLKKLEIDNYEINFNKETLEYYINVENNIDEIKVKYLTTNPSAKTEVAGGYNLQEGKNIVLIKVKSENEKNVTTYKININKMMSVFKENVEEKNQISNRRQLNKIETTTIVIVISTLCLFIIYMFFILIFKKNWSNLTKIIHKPLCILHNILRK